MEDLLGLGATIIVLDPNSDYVQLRKLIEDERVPYRQARKTEHAARIDLYRVPGIQNRRYSEDLVGPANPYTIRFSDLEAEDLCDVAGVPQTAERIREAVGNACARLRQRNVDFDPADLTRELAQFAGVPVDDPGGDPAVPLEDVRAGHGAPGEAPDGDDVDAASAFLRQLGAGRSRERTGRAAPAGRTAPAGRGAAGTRARPRARRTRCGPPGWPCGTSASWCPTRCGATATSIWTGSSRR